MVQVDRGEIVLLRAHTYYNGPLAGELEWKGKRYWFRAAQEEDCEDYPNLMEIVDPPAYVWPRLDVLDALFIAHVGSHWEYNRVTQLLDPFAQHPHGAGHAAYYDSPLARESHRWEPDGAVVGVFWLHPKQ